LLLANGANINWRKENGTTAVCEAVESSKLEAMKFLIAKGADITLKGNIGLTPLQWAKEHVKYYANEPRQLIAIRMVELLEHPEAYQDVFLNQLGQSKFRSKDYNGALTAYAKALKINPGNIESLYLRAESQIALGDFKSALGTGNQLVQLANNSPLSFLARGMAYAQLGEFNNALNDFNQAVLLPDTSEPDSSQYKGLLFDKRNNVLDKIEEKSHPEAFSEFNKALDSWDKDDYRSAVEYVTNAINKNQGFERYYYTRGALSSRQGGGLDSARSDLQKALTMNPFRKNSYLYLAATQYDLGDFSGALENFNKVRDIDPKDKFAIEYWGLSLAKMNEAEKRAAEENKNRKIDFSKFWNPPAEYTQNTRSTSQQFQDFVNEGNERTAREMENARRAQAAEAANATTSSGRNPCGFASSCTLGQGSEAKTYRDGKRVLSGSDIETCRLHPGLLMCQ
jgi:tetratricopeptide (TPR) repeat protein